jgi:hypothetical protein
MIIKFVSVAVVAISHTTGCVHEDVDTLHEVSVKYYCLPLSDEGKIVKVKVIHSGGRYLGDEVFKSALARIHCCTLLCQLLQRIFSATNLAVQVAADARHLGLPSIINNQSINQ